MASADWLAILGTGGVLGFILRPAIERLFSWFFRPQLVIEFPGAEPGCEVQSPAQNPTVKYLRLRIRNRGRTTAQKVSIYGTVLRQVEPGKSVPIFEFREEVLDLLPALTEKELEFRLAPGAYRYVVLCHTLKVDTCLHWDFVQKPSRLYERRFGPGRYRLHVFASSENSAAMAGDIIFDWDGTFLGLRAIGFARS